MSVADAKTWFDTNQKPLMMMMMKAGKLEDRKTVNMKPSWNHAFKSKNSKYEVVECPILTKGVFSMATEGTSSSYESTKNEDYLNSVSRLVVLKYKKDGRIVSFIMTVLGDKNYLEKKKFSMEGESYLSRDKELSGFVYYHSTEGDFVNSWKYNNGKVVAKVEIGEDAAPRINLKLMSYIEVVCTYTFDSYVDSQGTATIRGTRNCVFNYLTSDNGGSGGNPTDSNGSTSTPVTSGNGTTNTYDGLYNPPPAVPPTPCTCVNTCPVCGKCKDTNLLKSAGVGNCEICTCPLPVVLDELGSNPKAECIYQKLSNGPILQDFITRYFGATKPHQSFLGELNLTWTLGSVQGGFGQTIPIGYTNNNQSYSVEIRLDEVRLNGASNTKVALTMLHEALHAKLIADFYDDILSTDFTALFAY